VLAYLPGARKTLNYLYSEARRSVILTDGSCGLIGLAPVFIVRFALSTSVRRSPQPNVPIQRLSRTGVPQGWVCSASNSESLVPPQVPAWPPGSKTTDQGTLHCIDRSRLQRPSGHRRSQELRQCRKNRSFVSRVLAHYAIRFNEKRPYRPRLSLTAIAIFCSDPR
jgi:hypothetical protein